MSLVRNITGYNGVMSSDSQHVIKRANINRSASDVSALFKQAETGTDLSAFRATCETLSPEEVNTKNNNGQTLLYLAAKGGHLEFVQQLLTVKGLHINMCVDETGDTPLHVAARTDKDQVVATLLLYKADPLAQNSITGVIARTQAVGKSQTIFAALESAGTEGILRLYPSFNTGGSSSTKGKLVPVGVRDSSIFSGKLYVGKKTSSLKEKTVHLSKSPGKGSLLISWNTKNSSTAELHIPQPKANGGSIFGMLAGQHEKEPCQFGFYVSGAENPSKLSATTKFIFRASSAQERSCWLNLLWDLSYTSYVPRTQEQGTEFKQELQEMSEAISKKLIDPNHDRPVINDNSGKDSLQVLIGHILKLSSEDTFWKRRSKLEGFVEGLGVASEYRETINKVLKATNNKRPHTLVDHGEKSNGSPFAQLESVIAEISTAINTLKAQSQPAEKPKKKANNNPAPEPVEKVSLQPCLENLDELFQLYKKERDFEGSRPPPLLLTLLQEQKIVSRVVSSSMYGMITGKGVGSDLPMNDQEEGKPFVIGDVVFRVLPRSPLFHKTTGILNGLIWNQYDTVPASLLVKIEDVVVQLSTRVPGVPLDTMFTKSELVEYVDNYNLSVQFISSTLILPANVPLNQLVAVCVDAGGSKKRIDLVNTSHCSTFMSQFVSTNENKEFHLMSRNSLWALPQTKSAKLHPQVCQRLVEVNPLEIAMGLFMAITDENETINKLFDARVLTKEELERGLLLKLRAQDGTRLIASIELAQKLLKTGPITYSEFMKGMFPVMSQVYSGCVAQIAPQASTWAGVPRLLENWIFGTWEFLCHNLFKDQTEAIKTFTEQIMGTRPLSYKAYLHDKNEKPESIIEATLEKISFQQMPGPAQSQFLWKLSQLKSLKRISIRASSELTFTNINEFLRNKALLRLKIEDCSKIKEEDITSLQRLPTFDHPQIVEVVFENCSGLQDMENEFRPYPNLFIKIVSTSNKFSLENPKELLKGFNAAIQANEAIELPRALKVCLLQFTPAIAGQKDHAKLDALATELTNLFKQNQYDSDVVQYIIQEMNKFHFLKVAVEEGSMPLLKFLRSTGDSLFGSIPKSDLLSIALHKKHHEVMEYLIEYGDAANSIEWPFLHQVLLKKDFATAELILFHNNALADAQDVDAYQNNALGAIVSQPTLKKSFLQYFLRLNPCVHDAPNKEGYSTIHLATRGNADCFELLLSQGADIWTRAPNNKTPFLYLVSETRIAPNLDIIRAMFKAGYKANFEDLEIAVTECNLWALKWLLDPTEMAKAGGRPLNNSSARIAITSSRSTGPLSAGSAKRSRRVSSNADSGGGSPTPKDRDIVIGADDVLNQKVDVLSFLSPQRKCLAHLVPKTNDGKALLQYILEKAPACTSHFDIAGRTPLHYYFDDLTHPKSREFIKCILEAGGNINQAENNKLNLSPLEAVLKRNNSSVLQDVQWLCNELNADPSDMPNNKPTCLLLAVHTGNLALVEFLGGKVKAKLGKKMGEYLKMRDQDSQTAEQIASSSKNKELEKVLKKLK